MTCGISQLDEMLAIYEAVLADSKYTIDIKTPMDQALADSGHLKQPGRKRKRESGASDAVAPQQVSALQVSAGQRRAAAREASSSLKALTHDGDDEDGDDVEGEGSARTDVGSSGGRGADGSSNMKKKAAPRMPMRPRGDAALERVSRDWPIGTRVEALQADEGYFGAWFAGEVTGHIKSKDASGAKICVRYDAITEYDDETNETTAFVGEEDAKRVRPEPTKLADRAATSWAASLTVESPLQLSYDGGWWDVELQAISGTMYEVKAKMYDVVHTVELSALRPPPEWVWDLKRKQWKQTSVAEAEGPAAQARQPAPPLADEDEVVEADIEIEAEVEVEPMDDASD